MKWVYVKNLLEYFDHYSLDEFKDFIDHIDNQNNERNITEDNYSQHQLALIEFMEFFSQYETVLAEEGMINSFFKPYALVDENNIPKEHKNKRFYVVFKDGVQNLKNDIAQFLKNITDSNEHDEIHPKLYKVINNINQSIKMVDNIIAFNEPSNYNSYFVFNEQDIEKAESWIKQMKSFYSQLLTASPEDYGLSVNSTRYLQDIINRISRTEDLLNIKPNDSLLINAKMQAKYNLMNVFIDTLTADLCRNHPTIRQEYRNIREQIKHRLATLNLYDISDQANKGDFSRVLPPESEMTNDQTKIFREIEQLLLDMAELFDLQ